ncbi:hypothetical protein PCANC_26179 [Puccinia coronata f. sp. avenae]|uniref:Uncharacterized protein n=1 Tax=Puccinia coronata f. sp. avenae TaxID=200324 RepID=A0A2N5TIC3_9BASI|nr:hypothetical protein PCANC_26179 [Puccinia coronata f. sp. avenae]
MGTSTELIEPYDFLLKFIIIGESGTGKSCLLHHFLRSQPRHPSPHTIGVEFSSTIISLPSSSSLGSSFCRMKLQSGIPPDRNAFGVSLGTTIAVQLVPFWCMILPIEPLLQVSLHG